MMDLYIKNGDSIFKNKDRPWKEWSILLICLFIAFSLRLGELRRVMDSPLDPDVSSFITLANKMKPFSETGFYSARFELREPLYLLVAKFFFLLPGSDDLNIRFVSFLFSLLVIFLTYLLVRNWLGKGVGLVAASFLTFHTYCIEASARGLRCEFLTFLFLLFIYLTLINEKMVPLQRIMGAGIMSGLLFLTRTEFLFPTVLFFILLPLIERKKWNFLSALLAIIISIAIFLPHLIGMYRVHGDIFYTSNLGARFYTNLEFAGQPGFPSKEEIEQKGMFTGPKVTPFDYFFRFHTLPELFWGTAWGMAKVYIYLAIRYIPTKTWNMVKEQTRTTLARIRFILFKHPFRLLLSILIGIGLLGGLLGLWTTTHRSLYFILVIFQIQTAFLFSIGLETQVVTHTWPVALWLAAYFFTTCSGLLFNRSYPGLPGIKFMSMRKEVR
ncbi:MAG: glycosyltransferase family 39 protein [bacterium]